MDSRHQNDEKSSYTYMSDKAWILVSLLIIILYLNAN